MPRSPVGRGLRAVDPGGADQYHTRLQSPVAQLVEQMTVNHWVAGSSPARGANFFFQVLSTSKFHLNVPFRSRALTSFVG